MRASLLALSAAALAAIALSPMPKADAHGWWSHRHMDLRGRHAGPRVRGVVRRARPAKKVAAAKKVAKKGPGMCGTNMYWKDGRCQDARAKK
jgi:hypothetical protein